MAEEEKKYIQPSYKGQYDDKVNELYNKISNRQPFQFDADNDALYQQYVDRYMQGGRQAMKDTVGQAAGLTGGYTNSYAQNVGQQAYDQYMTGLNDKANEIYQMQMQAYQMEGDRLNNLLGTAASLADSDYNRLFNEAQMRQGLGDDSLLRQLLGMPEQSAGGGGGYGYGGGTYDPDLAKYQQALNDKYGLGLDVDGVYGPQTEAAIMKDNGVVANELFGIAPAEEEKRTFTGGGKYTRQTK